MGHIEGVVPRTSLMESRGIGEVCAILGIEGREEGAVLIDGAQCARFFRVIMTIAQTLLTESLGILFLTKGFSQISQ